jgi:hypothetical protein
MVMVLPMYEIEQPGVYYNTAAVIDADGSYLGKFRKQHIPQVKGFWEKFYFRPGNGGYPVFDTASARSACTSATTATSPRAGGRSASTAPRSCSTRRPPTGVSRVPVVDRAARRGGGQHVLRRGDQPGRHRAARRQRLLRPELLRRPARPVRSAAVSPRRSRRAARAAPLRPRTCGGRPRPAPAAPPPVAAHTRGWCRSAPRPPPPTSAMRSTGAGPHQSSLSGVAMYVVASTTPPRRVARRITRCS